MNKKNIFIYGTGLIGKNLLLAILLSKPKSIKSVVLFDKNTTQLDIAYLDVGPMLKHLKIPFYLTNKPNRYIPPIDLTLLTIRLNSPLKSNIKDFFIDFKKMFPLPKYKKLNIYIASNPVQLLYNQLKKSYPNTFPSSCKLDNARIKMLNINKQMIGVHQNCSPKHLQDKANILRNKLINQNGKSLTSATFFMLQDLLDYNLLSN